MKITNFNELVKAVKSLMKGAIPSRTFEHPNGGGWSIFVGRNSGTKAVPAMPWSAGDLTAFGDDSMANMVSGTQNAAFGQDSLKAMTTGSFNIAIGGQAAEHLEGSENTAVGQAAMWQTPLGDYNTVLGASAMRGVTGKSDFNVILGKNAFTSTVGGNNNTIVGYAGGYQVVGSNNVFFGFRAGQGAGAVSNTFLVHNANVGGNYASQSLLYGVFNATPASQYLRVNGRIGAKHTPSYADNAAAIAGGLEVGDFYHTAGAVKVVI